MASSHWYELLLWSALHGPNDLLGFQAVFALLLLIQVAMLPDSPRWCMAHGMTEEATQIIAQLEDKDSIDHPDVVLKRKEIEASLALESAGGQNHLPCRICDLTALVY